MFDQPEFEVLLRNNLKRYPHATLRGDAEVTAVVGHGDGRVRVTFTDRTDGREHAVDADYVLGCDGANSVVRTEIGSTMRDLKFEQRWLVVDVGHRCRSRPVGGRAPGVRPGARRHLHADRRCPLPLGVPAAARRNRQRITRAWPHSNRSSHPGLHTPTDDELELIRVTEYTFRAQIADRWRRGNVFLLGDAAHLTPPFIGQGMGAGLRDAMNLSWKLAGVLSGDLPRAVLDSYEQERKPHTRALIRLALTVGRSMTSGGEFGNLIRRVVVPQMHHIPGLRAKVVDSRTPALRRSALVHRSRRERRLAGTLCPNPAAARRPATRRRLSAPGSQSSRLCR